MNESLAGNFEKLPLKTTIIVFELVTKIHDIITIKCHKYKMGNISNLFTMLKTIFLFVFCFCV